MLSIKKRNFGLDVIRFFAIWLVLLQHGGYPLIKGLEGLKIGGFGVEVFFVLSGYLIGGILIKALEKENSLKSIWNFWVKRWFRILPVYYLMLAIKYFFFDDSVGVNILYYIFFLQNNFYGISFYSVTWSLVIEEWFYLLAPIFIFIVFKCFKSNKTRLINFCLFLLFILAIRLLYVYLYDVPYSGVNGNVPFRLDSLFIGVLLMFIKIKFNKFYFILAKLWVFIVSIIVLGSYLFFVASLPSNNSSINDLIFTRTIGFSFVSLFASLLIPFCEINLSIDKTKTAFNYLFNVVTYTSIFTYAIYLIHPLVFSVLIHTNPITTNYNINFIIAIVITYIFAAILYYGYESKWLKLRDKLYNK
jgi:peptidoglycan/LPS O-acetylase OafA/YrhL